MRHALSAWAPPYVLLERPTSHIHLIPVPRRESKGEADVDIARLPAKYPPAPQEYGFQKKGSLLTAPGVPITIRLSIFSGCIFAARARGKILQPSTIFSASPILHPLQTIL